MSVVELPKPEQLVEQRVILEGVGWDLYATLRNLAENRGKRMTYDHGTLEIMTLSSFHERLAQLIARFIDEWTVARDIPVIGCGSMTFQSEMLERGLEPDRCYYIGRADLVREQRQIDLALDPPPDLVIEVDYRSGSIDKLPIYASMAVSEVWRWRQEALTIYTLHQGEFNESLESQCLPGFPFQSLGNALRQRHNADETSLVRQFRQSLSPG